MFVTFQKDFKNHVISYSCMDKGDQLLKINEKPTFQKSREELRKKIQNLNCNYEGFSPRGKEVLKIAYVKSDEFDAQKHLLKSPPPAVTDYIGYCTRCSPARFFPLQQQRRFVSHPCVKERIEKDVCFF